MNRDEERLPEALAVERVNGDDTGDFVIARLDALEAEGDAAGVQRCLEIADWPIRLLRRDGAPMGKDLIVVGSWPKADRPLSR
jgi:hypothetical protein